MYGITFVLIFVIIVSTIYWNVKTIITTNIERELENSSYLINSLIQTAADVSIRNHLRTTSENSIEIAEHYYQQFKDGAMTEKEAKMQVIDSIKPLEIGTTGYVYLLDSQGVLVHHPYAELENTNISEFKFVQTQIEEKSGYIEYLWQNPDDDYRRSKVLYMSYFEPWDWIVSVSSYKSEFSDLINLNDFEKEVTALKFGEDGYPFIVDMSGTFLLHPSLKGRNVIEENDPQGIAISKMIENRNGILEYDWKNPEDKESRKKLMVHSEIQEFGWIIGSSAYKSDFYEALNALTELIMIASAIGLIILIALTVKISAMVIKPLKKLEKTVLEGVNGDLSVRVQVNGSDEVNQLGRHFNQFVENLESKNIKLEEEVYRRQKSAEELAFLNKNLEGIIEERTEELYAVQDKLVQGEKMMAINKLIKDIAHGMNTPLGNSKTSASLLELKVKKLQEDYASNNLSKITFEKFFDDFDNTYRLLVQGLKRSVSLIDMFKLITRDSAMLQKEAFNLRNEIEKAIALLNIERGVLTIHCDETLVINSFREVITLMVSNLVSNAKRHSHKEGEDVRIDILVVLEDKNLMIKVMDDGVGIDEIEMQHVFNPFYTTNASDNIGLGLSVVYHSVHSIMMGTIDMKNRSQGGLEITLNIPNIDS